MKSLAVISCGFIVAALSTLILLHKSLTPRFEYGPEPLKLAQPRPEDGAGMIRGVGYVEPVSQIRHLSFQVSGVIRECRIAVGDRVRAGDVLMVLENSEQHQAVQAAERELELARAKRDLTLLGPHPSQIEAAQRRVTSLEHQRKFRQAEMDRAIQLQERQSISISDYESATANARVLEAQHQEAQAALRYLETFVRGEDKCVAEAEVAFAATRVAVARQRTANTMLVSPCDGTILDVLRREGEASEPATLKPVALLADLTTLQVRAEIDERNAVRLRPGQRVLVSGLNLANRTAEGCITTVMPLMGKKTVFTGAATELKAVDVIQVLVKMPPEFDTPVGLRVDVTVFESN